MSDRKQCAGDNAWEGGAAVRCGFEDALHDAASQIDFRRVVRERLPEMKTESRVAVFPAETGLEEIRNVCRANGKSLCDAVVADVNAKRLAAGQDDKKAFGFLNVNKRPLDSWAKDEFLSTKHEKLDDGGLRVEAEIHYLACGYEEATRVLSENLGDEAEFRLPDMRPCLPGELDREAHFMATAKNMAFNGLVQRYVATALENDRLQDRLKCMIHAAVQGYRPWDGRFPSDLHPRDVNQWDVSDAPVLFTAKQFYDVMAELADLRAGKEEVAACAKEFLELAQEHRRKMMLGNMDVAKAAKYEQAIKKRWAHDGISEGKTSEQQETAIPDATE